MKKVKCDPEVKAIREVSVRGDSHIQTTYKPQKAICELTYFSPNHHM